MKYTFERGLIKKINNTNDSRKIQVMLNTDTGRIWGTDGMQNVKNPNIVIGSYAGYITRWILTLHASLALKDYNDAKTQYNDGE